MLISLLVISLGLIIFLVAISVSIGGGGVSLRSSLTPFECGFDSSNSSRKPFSVRFFISALVFLVFDAEIVILLPVVILMNSQGSVINYSYMFIILLIVIVGLFYEWGEGSLDWE